VVSWCDDRSHYRQVGRFDSPEARPIFNNCRIKSLLSHSLKLLFFPSSRQQFFIQDVVEDDDDEEARTDSSRWMATQSIESTFSLSQFTHQFTLEVFADLPER